jgi:hypothetical protein
VTYSTGKLVRRLVDGALVDRIGAPVRAGVVDDAVEPAPDGLLGPQAQHPQRGGVHERRRALGVHAVDALARALQDALQVAADALQLGLGALALRDVHHGAHHPDGLPGRVAEDEAPVEDLGVRAVAALDAVLVLPRRLAALDGGVQAPGDAGAVLGVQAARPALHARLHVLRRDADHGLEVLVPPPCARAQVPVPDGVVRGAGQEPEALVGEPQRLLGLLAERDVAQEAREARLALGRDGDDGKLRGEDAAVAAQGGQLHPLAQHGGVPGGDDAGEAPAVPFAHLGGDDDLRHLAAHDLHARPPEHALGGGVPLRDEAPRVDGHDGVEARVQHRAAPGVGRLRLGVEACVVKGDGRARREVLRERRVLGGVAPGVRAGEGERDGAQHAAARLEGHEEAGAGPGGDKEAPVVVVLRGGEERVLGNLPREEAASRADDLRHAGRVVGQRGPAARDLAGQLGLGGVDVRDGRLANGARVVEQVHGAPVAEERDAEAREVGERGLRGEGAREEGARLREEGLPVPGAAVLRHVAEEVDGAHDAARGVPQGRGLDDAPALLARGADAEAQRALGALPPLQRVAAGQLRERDDAARLVQDVPARGKLLRGRHGERLLRGESQGAQRGAVRVDDGPAGGLDGDAFGEAVEDRAKAGQRQGGGGLVGRVQRNRPRVGLPHVDTRQTGRNERWRIQKGIAYLPRGSGSAPQEPLKSASRVEAA